MFLGSYALGYSECIVQKSTITKSIGPDVFVPSGNMNCLSCVVRILIPEAGAVFSVRDSRSFVICSLIETMEVDFFTAIDVEGFEAVLSAADLVAIIYFQLVMVVRLILRFLKTVVPGKLPLRAYNSRAASCEIRRSNR